MRSKTIKYTYQISLFIMGLLFIVGCGNAATPQATATTKPTSTSTPTSTPEPSITPTSTDTPTPTNTATPSPLEPSQIFDLVSPSIAFIETDASSGSGVFIAGNYLLTNAHVVWPFNKVRIVFPDGTEIKDAPVQNWDLLADLAVIGPLDVDIEPQALVDGEDLIIGSDVYLIGYPGEVDEFPQPTISRGLISRTREWEPIELTYLQTDASITGGQSGGVLVSELGEVIGISGFAFANSEFGLVASAKDISPRIQGLINNEDVDGLGNRLFNVVEGSETHNVSLGFDFETEIYLIKEKIGTEISLEMNGADYGIRVIDPRGQLIISNEDGKESSNFEIAIDGPYFIEVFSNGSGAYSKLSSNVLLEKYEENDGIRRPKIGETIKGSIDYPQDVDTYRITLDKGDIINIRVESVLLDPYLTVDIFQVNLPPEDAPQDDDSGGGLFGQDAELTFIAPNLGTYLIIVEAYGWEFGGYFLTIEEPYEGAPTPIAPKPTPSPIGTELGGMSRFTGAMGPKFTILYPYEWLPDPIQETNLAQVCDLVVVEACFFNLSSTIFLSIDEERISEIGLGDLSREAYIEILVNNAEANPNIELISRGKVINSNEIDLDLLTYQIIGTPVQLIKAVALENDVGFNATIIVSVNTEEFDDEVADNFQESLDALVEFMFDSISVLDKE